VEKIREIIKNLEAESNKIAGIMHVNLKENFESKWYKKLLLMQGFLRNSIENGEKCLKEYDN
jgi:hypothetical protein